MSAPVETPERPGIKEAIEAPKHLPVVDAAGD